MMRSTLLLLVLTASTPALAQQSERAEERARVKAITEIDFDDLEVRAPIRGPDGKLISVSTNRPVFPPMFQLRTDFNQEMAESLAELR